MPLTRPGSVQVNLAESDGVLSSVLDQAVGAGAVRRVLDALGQVLPEEGYGHLTGLDIRKGWGNVLKIRLYTPLSQTKDGEEFGARVRRVVDDALGAERHVVEIVWDAKV
jgi:hypothetical protein